MRNPETKAIVAAESYYDPTGIHARAQSYNPSMSARLLQLQQAFRDIGVSSLVPGFYDDPAFVEAEQQFATLLDVYTEYCVLAAAEQSFMEIKNRIVRLVSFKVYLSPNPPSTTTIWPVKKCGAVERYMTVFTTSSAVPFFFIGVWSANFFACTGSPSP